MEKRRLIRPAIIYGAVWLVCLALYWGSLATGALGGGGIMGYVILTFHFALPVAGIAAALLVGRVAELGRPGHLHVRPRPRRDRPRHRLRHRAPALITAQTLTFARAVGAVM